MITSSTLPPASHLQVDALAAGLNDVTNSYKFYWLLALLAHLQETQQTVITIEHLVARMVADVWYPSNYFRLSFGKQDRLSQIALLLKTEHDLMADAHRTEVISAALYSLTNVPILARKIRSLAKYVPYRFLRPFFHAQLSGPADWKVNDQIRKFADLTFADQYAPCLYRFIDQTKPAIEIHPQWADYLQRHLAIVEGYCLWHLTIYLQRNNPNVPNITGKLFAPEQRNLSTGRRFWRLAHDSLGELRCIYSGEIINIDSFSLDHFLPWSYVAHDLLWNLIPTPQKVNSTKSDQLPDLVLYFQPFAQLQFSAFRAVAATHHEALLEDHVMLFRMQSVDEVCALPFEGFRQLLQDTIAPQIQIARNMGFPAGWSYPKP